MNYLKSLEIIWISIKILLNPFQRNIKNYIFKIIFFITYNDESLKAWKRLKKIENNIVKDVRNLFKLKKEIDAIFLRNLFGLETENESSKDNIIKDIRNLFELEIKEDFYQPVSVSNYWSNYYTEYDSNGDRYKTLSTEEYLNKIRVYLKDIINCLKKSDRWINLINSPDNSNN